VKSEFVFRKPLLSLIATTAIAGCFSIFVVAAVSMPKPNGSAFFGAVHGTSYPGMNYREWKAEVDF
jgi:hypothetical protein